MIFPAESEKIKLLPLNFDLQLFAEGGDKTEEPTDKKRRDARKKGQVARSQELNAAFVLLAGFFSIKLLWEYIYEDIASYSAYIFANLSTFDTSTESIMQMFLEIVILLVKTAFPIMIGITIFGLAVSFYQVGFMVSTEKIEFKLDNLNPINGFGRIFSKRSLVEMFKSLFKIALHAVFYQL